MRAVQECPVCFETLGSAYTAELPCHHMFCVSCVARVRRKGGACCPLRRASFSEYRLLFPPVHFTCPETGRVWYQYGGDARTAQWK